MDKLIYKTFVWPHNPSTYRDEFIRTPHFQTVDGETYFTGMSDMQRVITGTGVFFGPDAFNQFKKLSRLFEESTPGNLNHPVWGICYCYFTGLELTQEPKNDCVGYKFTFTRALTNGEVPK